MGYCKECETMITKQNYSEKITEKNALLELSIIISNREKEGNKKAVLVYLRLFKEYQIYSPIRGIHKPWILKSFSRNTFADNTLVSQTPLVKNDKRYESKGIHHEISNLQHTSINKIFDTKINIFKEKKIREFKKMQNLQNIQYNLFFLNL